MDIPAKWHHQIIQPKPVLDKEGKPVKTSDIVPNAFWTSKQQKGVEIPRLSEVKPQMKKQYKPHKGKIF